MNKPRGTHVTHLDQQIPLQPNVWRHVIHLRKFQSLLRTTHSAVRSKPCLYAQRRDMRQVQVGKMTCWSQCNLTLTLTNLNPDPDSDLTLTLTLDPDHTRSSEPRLADAQWRGSRGRSIRSSIAASRAGQP